MLIACTHIIHGQISGCTDPLANNYNPAATINDGTCTYPPSSISPSRSINLPSIINETSGLVIDGDSAWTHNDDADINLYRFSIKDIGYSAFPLKGAKNIEWEDMSSDEVYFYLGDFGNNSAGNRTDLRILRVKKTDVLKGSMTFDTIRFAYEDQIISGSQAANTTDFDCEAMAVIGDSIVVFSKMWTTQKSVIYTFPKQPGSYIAKKKAILDIGGLITGACAIPNKQLILLCGYSRLLQPFLYLLYDFPGTEYHAGNKRKVSLNIPFHQVEGIATSNGLMAYCTNEKLVQSFLEINPAFHSLDLTNLLKQYLQGGNSAIPEENSSGEIHIMNQKDNVIISGHPSFLGTPYRILNLEGDVILSSMIETQSFSLPTENLSSGYYLQYKSYLK
ncbi:MAG: T9SS C-terminal target domain-containing protein, partial [Candidatus Kapaibacteriota bacterium]